MLAPAALAGTVAAELLPSAPGAAWVVPVGLAIIVSLGLVPLRVVLAAVAGFALAEVAIGAELEQALAPALEGREVPVRGWIDDFPRPGNGQTSFSLRVVGARASALPERLRLTWYGPAEPLRPGEGLCLRAKLRRIRGFVNPGGFDYEHWAFLEGFGASGYVRSGRACELEGGGLARWWLGVRARLATRIASAFDDPDAAALVGALVLGERGALSATHRASLRRTGTSHLFAISGLHVGLVAALVLLAVRWLWLRLPPGLAGYDLEVAVPAGLAAATVYAALAGFTVPTERALIMLAVAAYALLARRRLALGGAFASALVFVLAWDPLAPSSASFWLSFAAVGLLLVAARGREQRTRWRRWRAFVALQWKITLGLLPAVALVFGQVSLLAPLANLLAIPLFSLLWVPLALGFAGLVAVIVPPVWVTAPIAQLAAWTWAMLDAGASLAWAAWPVPALSLGACVLASLGAMLVVGATPPLPGRYLGWLMLIAVLEGYGQRPDAGELRATVLDVGHGLAVVVRTAHHALVYDTGPRYRSGFDAGASVVVPALNALAVARLDRLVVSHADNDHAGGMAAVRAAYPGARLIAGSDVTVADAEPCRRGQRWHWDGVEFAMLHPPTDFGVRGNDGSCVLAVTTAAGALILTGDIEARAESALLANESSLGARVVVVPHHGSSTSSTPDFVAAIAPDAAIVSAAFESRWGFPRPEIRARWRAAGARVVVTGEAGAVSFVLGPRRGLRLHEARATRRYWRAAVVPGESRKSEL